MKKLNIILYFIKDFLYYTMKECQQKQRKYIKDLIETLATRLSNKKQDLSYAVKIFSMNHKKNNWGVNEPSFNSMKINFNSMKVIYT